MRNNLGHFNKSNPNQSQPNTSFKFELFVTNPNSKGAKLLTRKSKSTSKLRLVYFVTGPSKNISSHQLDLFGGPP